ncbi:MAG: hypothetical protein ROW48_01080 [Bellilinea sp.]|jgi:hypothetical protein
MHKPRYRLILRNLFIGFLFILTQVRSEYDSTHPVERVRQFTRWQEFDYVTWTINALWLKQLHGALNLPRYLDPDQQRQIVFDYLDLVQQYNHVRAEINAIYADPRIPNPEQAAAHWLAEQRRLTGEVYRLAPLAEAVLQAQLTTIIDEKGLGLGGQPIPPLLYHVTTLPRALIVSPREVIRQDVNISVLPDLTLDQITRLEEQVERELNVSALVVPIGGVGIYPTMVMNTTDLYWLAEVIAHEWIHNTLTLRPLGALYMANPPMRTINETAATIAGKEMGRALVARYYPERLPPPPAEPAAPRQPSQPGEPPRFDFRAEMRETRVTVDALLAEGKITQAEEYMEMRRRLFWDNGYRIRRLNQAYFAFYGAYADQPGGAAGEDPVAAAVRNLRAESPSLAAFINRIAWVTSYDALSDMLRR